MWRSCIWKATLDDFGPASFQWFWFLAAFGQRIWPEDLASIFSFHVFAGFELFQSWKVSVLKKASSGHRQILGVLWLGCWYFTPSGHEGKEFLRAAAVAATEKMKDRKEYFAGQARLFARILGRSIGSEHMRVLLLADFSAKSWKRSKILQPPQWMLFGLFQNLSIPQFMAILMGKLVNHWILGYSIFRHPFDTANMANL